MEQFLIDGLSLNTFSTYLPAENIAWPNMILALSMGLTQYATGKFCSCHDNGQTAEHFLKYIKKMADSFNKTMIQFKDFNFGKDSDSTFVGYLFALLKVDYQMSRIKMLCLVYVYDSYWVD